jgi:DivIVA domain-containing protein
VALAPEEISSQQFPVKLWGYDKDKVDAFLKTVANEYREALRSTRPAPAPAPPPKSPPSFEGIGDQVASILDSAALGAAELRSAAEREAQAIRTSAAEEAAETVEAALDQLNAANQAKAAAEQEADAVRAAARYESSRLEQEARDRAAQLERDVGEKVADLERAANANVAAVLAEARRRYEHLRTAERKAVARLSAVEALVQRARAELPEDQLDTGDRDDTAVPELGGVVVGTTADRPGDDARANDRPTRSRRR